MAAMVPISKFSVLRLGAACNERRAGMVAGAYTTRESAVALVASGPSPPYRLLDPPHRSGPCFSPPEGDRFMRNVHVFRNRRALTVLVVSAVLACAMPRLSSASGGGEPSSMPSSPPPQPTTLQADQPMSPEQKAAADRKTAEGLYADGYKECDKAKADLAMADSLSTLTHDPKAMDKAKKLSEGAQKRLAKQIDKFMTATNLDPKYHEAWNMLGYCLRKTGDTQKALTAYWTCLQIKPDYAPAHEYLGEAYLEAGNLEKAQAELTWLKDKDAQLAAELDKKVAQYVQAHPQTAPATATSGSGSGSN
jgi:Flp pilus assembly protein TadD